MTSAVVPGAWVGWLTSLAEEQATRWFPELGAGAVSVRVLDYGVRSRSAIARLELADGSRTRRVVAKLRRDEPRERTVSRPGIVPDPLTAREQAALEFRSLCNIYRRLGTGSPTIRGVRPLEHLPEHAGLVMEHVDATPGSQLLTSVSRVSARPRPSASRRPAEAMFRNAGTWLREFHASTDEYHPASRPGGDPTDLFAEFARYLGARVGGDATLLAQEAGRVVPAVVSGEPATAVGHGDFAVRNLLVEPSGRVCVIDPMPRWRVPVYEDLARFVVGVRLQGLQLYSQGAAYGAGFLEARERDFVEAYHGPAAPDWPQLLAYQLLVLFDKWAALASRRDRNPVRGSVLRSRLEDRYVAAEARRLLRSLDRLP